MVHNFRASVPVGVAYDIVHDVAQGQGEVVGLALAQHFGEVALGGNVYQQDALSVHSQPSAQIEHGRAFSDTAFLVRYRDYFCVCHMGSSFLYRLAAHKGRRLCNDYLLLLPRGYGTLVTKKKLCRRFILCFPI